MLDLPITEAAMEAAAKVLRAREDHAITYAHLAEDILSAALPHLFASLAENEAVVEVGARAAWEDRWPHGRPLHRMWYDELDSVKETWRGNFSAGLRALGGDDA